MNRQEAPMGAEELKWLGVHKRAAEADAEVGKARKKKEFLDARKKGAEAVEDARLIVEAEELTKQKILEDEIKKRDDELKKRAA